MPVPSVVSDVMSCFVSFSFQTLTLNPNFMVLAGIPFPVSASLVVTGLQVRGSHHLPRLLRAVLTGFSHYKSYSLLAYCDSFFCF